MSRAMFATGLIVGAWFIAIAEFISPGSQWWHAPLGFTVGVFTGTVLWELVLWQRFRGES